MPLFTYIGWIIIFLRRLTSRKRRTVRKTGIGRERRRYTEWGGVTGQIINYFISLGFHYVIGISLFHHQRWFKILEASEPNSIGSLATFLPKCFYTWCRSPVYPGNSLNLEILTFDWTLFAYEYNYIPKWPQLNFEQFWSLG